MRAGLDGSSKTAIVTDFIHTPNGVALDYEKKIVYWVDGKFDTLEMVNYDGRCVCVGRGGGGSLLQSLSESLCLTI